MHVLMVYNDKYFCFSLCFSVYFIFAREFYLKPKKYKHCILLLFKEEIAKKEIELYTFVYTQKRSPKRKAKSKWDTIRLRKTK